MTTEGTNVTEIERLEQLQDLEHGSTYRLGGVYLCCKRENWGPDIDTRGWSLFGGGLHFLTGECVGGSQLYHYDRGELTPTQYSVADLICVSATTT